MAQAAAPGAAPSAPGTDPAAVPGAAPSAPNVAPAAAPGAAPSDTGIAPATIPDVAQAAAPGAALSADQVNPVSVTADPGLPTAGQVLVSSHSAIETPPTLSSPPALRPRKRSRCMAQVDGPLEEDKDDDDDDDEDEIEEVSKPSSAANPLLTIICLGCRQESGLYRNTECPKCSDEIKVNFYGRNIHYDCKCRSNQKIRCPKCCKDEWKY